VNNVRTSFAIGGGGGGALGINIGVDIAGSTPEVSDWQFSKLYIWNYHLSDSDFKSTSQALNAELVNITTDAAGGACQPCAHASHSTGGTATSRRPACLACPAFKNTTQMGSTVLQECLCVPGHGAVNITDPAAACAPCATGRYAPGGANDACRKCGFGAVTEPALGARAFEQCMCDARIGLRAS